MNHSTQQYDGDSSREASPTEPQIVIEGMVTDLEDTIKNVPKIIIEEIPQKTDQELSPNINNSEIEIKQEPKEDIIEQNIPEQDISEENASSNKPKINLKASTPLGKLQYESENRLSSDDEVFSKESEDEDTDSDDDEDIEESQKKSRQSLLPQPEFNENIVLDMMLAMRTCVLATQNSNEPVDVEEKDFSIVKSYKISRTGTQKRFIAKDFAPKAFRFLRREFGTNTAEYLHSWSDLNIEQQKSLGKSGSVFMFSSDKKFVLKTITQSESKFLRGIFEEYCKHMISFPNSLLTKIYGHHRVDVKGKKVYFVILGNVIATNLTLHETYDLKGSSIGRSLNQTLKKNSPSLRPKTTVMKDNDFIANGRKLTLSVQTRDLLLKQIEDDCSFLERLKIMDYSLLVGIHKQANHRESMSDEGRLKIDPLSLKKVPSCVYFLEEVKEDTVKNRKLKKTLSSVQKSPAPPRKKLSIFQSDSGGIESAPIDNGSKEIYFLGIIDFFQKYNKKKKMAHMAKTLRYNSDQLSTVKPSHYASRFLEFLRAKAIVGITVRSSSEPPREGLPEMFDRRTYSEPPVTTTTSEEKLQKKTKSALKNRQVIEEETQSKEGEIQSKEEETKENSGTFIKLRRDSIEITRATLERSSTNENIQEDEE